MNVHVGLPWCCYKTHIPAFYFLLKWLFFPQWLERLVPWLGADREVEVKCWAKPLVRTLLSLLLEISTSRRKQKNPKEIVCNFFIYLICQLIKKELLMYSPNEDVFWWWFNTFYLLLRPFTFFSGTFELGVNTTAFLDMLNLCIIILLERQKPVHNYWEDKSVFALHE